MEEMYRNLLCHLYTIYIDDFFFPFFEAADNYFPETGVVEHTRILVYKVNSRKLLVRRDD